MPTCLRVSATASSGALFVLVVAVFMGCVGLAAAKAMAMETTLAKVVMDDGVELATTIKTPDGEGPWPVVLMRTPYGRDGGNGFDLTIMVMQGYVLVSQDTRGTGDSTGVNDVFFSDRADGLETLDWVLEQPWCDGRVAQFGMSAVAFTSYLIGPGADPGLVCQYMAVSSADVYTGAIYHGGVLKEADATEWLEKQGVGHLLDEWRAHPSCDSYWDPVRGMKLGEPVGAAAVHIGGWYDLYTQDTLDSFNFYKSQASDWAAERQFVIIGPWTHYETGMQVQGELKYPKNAAQPIFTDIFDWFKYCFNGSHPKIDAWAPVRYYVMGDVDDDGAPGNEWRQAEAWPPAATVYPIHLTNAGGLSWEAEGSAPETSHSFIHDPADPSPTLGGRNLSLPAGPFDQRPAEERADALVFSSEPLVEPVELCGRVRVALDVSTSGTDGDLHVRLTDVYPDGRSMLITEASQALRYREGCEAPVDVTSDEIMAVEVDLWSTCIIINAGHSLRVVVSGSNSPRYALNSGWAEGDLDGGPTSMTVYTGGAHAARVLVSVPDASEHMPPVDPPAGEPVAEAAPESAGELVEVIDATPDPDAGAEMVTGDEGGDGGAGCVISGTTRDQTGTFAGMLALLGLLFGLRARRSRSLARR